MKIMYRIADAVTAMRQTCDICQKKVEVGQQVVYADFMDTFVAHSRCAKKLGSGDTMTGVKKHIRARFAEQGDADLCPI